MHALHIMLKYNCNCFREMKGTALIDAARRGHATVVCFLLAQGADINATDNVRTASRLSPAAAQMCLRSVADRGVVTQAGCTALMRAASGGYLKVAMLLIKHGADLDMADQVRQSAQRSPRS